MFYSLGGGPCAAVNFLLTHSYVLTLSPSSLLPPFWSMPPSPSSYVAPGAKTRLSPPGMVGMTEKAFQCAQTPHFSLSTYPALTELWPHQCSCCSLSCRTFLPWASAPAFPWLWNILPGPRQSEAWLFFFFFPLQISEPLHCICSVVLLTRRPYAGCLWSASLWKSINFLGAGTVCPVRCHTPRP